jgi:hypothetical protein
MIPLQLLQRLAYEILLRLIRNLAQTFCFSRLSQKTKAGLTEILNKFHSKFQMPPIIKIVSLEKANNFYIGRFWSA